MKLVFERDEEGNWICPTCGGHLIVIVKCTFHGNQFGPDGYLYTDLEIEEEEAVVMCEDNHQWAFGEFQEAVEDA